MTESKENHDLTLSEVKQVALMLVLVVIMIQIVYFAFTGFTSLIALGSSVIVAIFLE